MVESQVPLMSVLQALQGVPPVVVYEFLRQHRRLFVGHHHHSAPDSTQHLLPIREVVGGAAQRDAQEGDRSRLPGLQATERRGEEVDCMCVVLCYST